MTVRADRVMKAIAAAEYANDRRILESQQIRDSEVAALVAKCRHEWERIEPDCGMPGYWACIGCGKERKERPIKEKV